MINLHFLCIFFPSKKLLFHNIFRKKVDIQGSKLTIFWKYCPFCFLDICFTIIFFKKWLGKRFLELIDTYKCNLVICGNISYENSNTKKHIYANSLKTRAKEIFLKIFFKSWYFSDYFYVQQLTRNIHINLKPLNTLL